MTTNTTITTTDTATTPTTATVAGYELRVLSGPQQGARIPVSMGRPLKVSHQLTGDVMLRSVSGGALDLHLEVHRAGVAVRLAAGVVGVVGGQSLEVGGVTDVPLGSILTVNGVEVHLCALHKEGVSAEAQGSVGVDAALASAEATVTDEAEPAGGEPPVPAKAGWLPGAAASPLLKRSMLGGLALVATSLSMWAVATVVSPPQTPQAQASKAQALLHSRGWGDTRVEAVAGGHLAVLGVFPSVEDRTRALRVLSGEGLSVEMAANIEASALEAVRELLRVKGVTAQVQEVAPGHIRVDAGVEPKLAERVEVDLRADVVGLKSLEFNNIPPKPVTRAPTVDDPGKRVVGVMPGKPSFVVTADGAKYFVGAMLPSGHRIREIEGRSVRMDREGQSSTLQF